MKVYKVCSDGSWCAFKTIDAAIDLLATEIEAEVNSMDPGEETRDYHIEVDEMTEEELSNLPEFDGF